MSNSSTNPPAPQSSSNQNSLSSMLAVLLSPFLWVAVVGVGFIAYTLWPQGSEGDGADKNGGADVGFWESISSGLGENALIIAAIVAVIIALVALGAGTKKAWKNEARVTEWMVYAIAAIAIIGVFFYLGTQYIFQDEAAAVRNAMREEVAKSLDPRNAAADWSWLWYVGALLLGGMMLVGLFTGGDKAASGGGKAIVDSIAKSAWPIAIALVAGLILWAIADGQFNTVGSSTRVKPAAVQTQPAHQQNITQQVSLSVSDYLTDKIGRLPDLTVKAGVMKDKLPAEALSGPITEWAGSCLDWNRADAVVYSRMGFDGPFTRGYIKDAWQIAFLSQGAPFTLELERKVGDSSCT